MRLKITQIRSTIKRKEDQKRTIAALGLGKINRVKIHDDTPVIRGMIKKVVHLVKVEELKEETKKAASKPKKSVKKATEKKEVKTAKSEKSEDKEIVEPTAKTEKE